MITFEHVGVRYPNQASPALTDVCLEVSEGQLVLVAGRTGAGKSTLLGAINGHVPYFTGGDLSGRVVVGGLDTRTHPPREMAEVVGVVGQDPLRGFVTDSVEEELAYGMEQQGFAPDVMRRRVEDVLDLLSIADIRARPLRTLSGGQQQRVAIASVLAGGARVLVLDEPTSALDPTSAEEVLGALLRLVHDMGFTVAIAEHRLERVLEYADMMVLVDAGGVTVGSPSDIMKTSPIAPPVVELGRLVGWSPVPLSVRDARRVAGPLRKRLAPVILTSQPVILLPKAGPSEAQSGPPPEGGLSAQGVVVRYGPVVAVRDVSVEFPAGQVTALMGRNGSGKSSLLWALTGVGPCQGGSWTAGGVASGAGADALRTVVRLVPQTAGDLLYLDSVAAECAAADRQNRCSPGTCRGMLDEIVPGVPDASHPSDLSEGQRLGLALAVQMTGAPAVMLLDEPTRGLDYAAKDALGQVLRRCVERGMAVALATHDVEFVARFADRAVVLAQGEVIQTGSNRDVLAASATFAPQVAKVMAPEPYLTVDDVVAALEGAR